MAPQRDLRHSFAAEEAFGSEEMSLRVGIVCPREDLKMSAARAFDDAPAEWEIWLSAEPPRGVDVLVSVDVSLPGAVPMDLDDPGAVIDRIKERVAPRPWLVAVVGASGGCGTTSIALHLAAAAPSGSPAALVDLQPGGWAAFRLGISDEQLPGDATREPVVLPVAGGFRVLFAADPVPTGALFEAAFDHARRVIADAPVEVLARSSRPPDRVVLVMTPTIPSATRAGLLLRNHPDLSWVPVTNRTGPGSETTRVDIERILGRRVALELPCSPGLRDAEDDLKLLTSPFSPWWMRIRQLSEAL